MTVKTSTKKGREFMERLNTDTEFRNRFLDHPVKTVKEFGIPLEPKEEKDLEEVVRYLKKDIKHIFEIPAGYIDILEHVGFRINLPPKIEPTNRIVP